MAPDTEQEREDGGRARPTLWRVLGENVAIMLAYWGLSHINYLVFRKVGVLPMPVWPAAGLALVAAFYRGCWVAPGIALGTVLANHCSLGSSWAFAWCISVMNTLGPLVGAAVMRRRVTRGFDIKGLADVVVCFLGALIVTPVLTATGGIGSKWLLGLIPGDAAAGAWLKWAMAHSLGTLFFGLPVFALVKGERGGEEL